MAGRFVGIVQARMTSTRLPGKVLLPLAGRAAILHVVDRLRRVRGLDDFVVAAPDTPEDRPLVDFLRGEGVPVFAWNGEPADLLGRYIAAGRALDADGILMVDSDCPLFDPDTASRMIAALRAASDAEYVRISPYTIEGGVACLRLSAFERIDREGARGSAREHATLEILRRPESFRIVDVPAAEAFSDAADAHRFWLDTRDDYDFLRTVFERLSVGLGPGPGQGPEPIDLRDVILLLRREPELRAINAHVQQNDPLAEDRA